MTGRRPLVAFVALLVVPLPACLHISAQVDSTKQQELLKNSSSSARTAEPAPPRMEFATLPRVPGAVVPTRGTPPSAPGVATSAQKPTVLPPNGPPRPVEQVTPTVWVDPPGRLPPLTPQPGPAEPPLLAAVRAYVEGRPDRAIEIIRKLNPQNQDVVLSLLPILARSATADLNNDPATVASLVDQLRATAARLEPRAALQIDKLAFCKDVSGYGRFVPWPENQPYKPNAQARLYLEVRNLGSQPAADGFVTHVHAAVEVRDAYGKLVEQIDPDDWRRRVSVVRFEKRLGSRSPLHDFHVLYLFSVPAAPGVYTVTIELRDAAGRRTVKTQPVQFCVAGP
jgi:hypothetical protein